MFFVLLFFCVVFLFYFIKISKFALPGVMLMYERTSNGRKKERKKERKGENGRYVGREGIPMAMDTSSGKEREPVIVFETLDLSVYQ